MIKSDQKKEEKPLLKDKDNKRTFEHKEKDLKKKNKKLSNLVDLILLENPYLS